MNSILSLLRVAQFVLGVAQFVLGVSQFVLGVAQFAPKPTRLNSRNAFPYLLRNLLKVSFQFGNFPTRICSARVGAFLSLSEIFKLLGSIPQLIPILSSNGLISNSLFGENGVDTK